jgi:hypothetical protein
MNYNLNVKYPSFCRFVAFIPLAPETKTRFLHSFEIKPKKTGIKAVNKTTTNQIDQALSSEQNYN